ncbi:SDR family oxidoreductase [Mycobacterium sp. 21AC1]|uniref:SDR family NAD(P)-dependent oxidoreductase n=1 Tax=[Mycobacterium] appelbergii TaxID=2939269 RepID=UPI0029394F0B|nr:SDR family oxidoreductase [Mycobacterium sp. 21AC1]MDV3125914.1 SDR family oxidoreductase [Mycobacterium sp. 21AC1]
MNETPRSALITGASRGIGLQIAKQLATHRMGLTISSRTESDLDAVAPMLRELGAPTVTVAAVDMTDVDALPHLVTRHRQAHEDLSALIVNAGVGTAGPVAAYPPARMDKALTVNFRAPFALVQAALPLLRESAARNEVLGAKIIVLASITGVYAERGLAAYGASKAAVLSLVEALNAEEAAHGVVATAIAPGYVDTDMSAWVHDQIPPHTMISPEDIAILATSLLSLSRRAMISRIIVARAGTDGFHA